jgi:hypothetical protein
MRWLVVIALSGCNFAAIPTHGSSSSPGRTGSPVATSIPVRVVSPGRPAASCSRTTCSPVLQCPCGGRRSVIAIVTDPGHAQTLVTALGLSSVPVTFAPARSPPQAELAWDEAA